MQLTDFLAQMGGLQSMARELGISESQASRGTAALIPAILGGLKKQAQSQPAGIEGLSGLFDQVLAPQPTDVSQGNEVLGQIFGSKDVSRAVAQNAATQSGLDPSLLKKMLSLLAMLVTGFMAKQGGDNTAAPSSAGGGGLGALLGGLLGGQTTGGAALGSAAPGLGAMLDLNGHGNPLDDILRMAGKAMG